MLHSYEFRLDSQNSYDQMNSLQTNLSKLNLNKNPFKPNSSNPILHTMVLAIFPIKIGIHQTTVIHSPNFKTNLVSLAKP